MSSNVKKIAVNGKAIKDELFSKTGKTFSQISREMGFAEGYISKSLNQNYVTGVAANLLKVMYGIDAMNFTKDEKNNVDVSNDSVARDTEEKASVSIEPIDYERLGDVIYKSVYEAVKKALAE